MELGAEAARRAWAQLADVNELTGTQVIVKADSPLAPRGWIGIVTVGDTIIVSVPHVGLKAAVSSGIAGLAIQDVTRPHLVLPRLPPVRTVRGPAALLYPPHGYRVPQHEPVTEVARGALDALLRQVDPDDLDESGLAAVTRSVFAASQADGAIVAACGFREWPNNVAHLSVLVHPDHRGKGLGQRVAAATIQRALDEGLLPQWRARPPASRALACKLGLIDVGAQLSLEPA